MELSIDDFFKILFDPRPEYTHSYEEVYTEWDKLIGMKHVLKYKNFKNPYDFQTKMNGKARDVLLEFQKGYSIGKFNRSYLAAYISHLKDQEDFFKLGKVGEKETRFHIYSSIKSDLFGDGDGNLKPEKLNQKVGQQFIDYNYLSLTIVRYLSEELETFLSESDGSEATASTTEKLELNFTLSDIALLFRLMEENKVFSAKHRTHIYRVIKNTFKAPDKSTYNEGSIKNAYNDPDPNSLKNIEILLANMKASLKNK